MRLDIHFHSDDQKLDAILAAIQALQVQQADLQALTDNVIKQRQKLADAFISQQESFLRSNTMAGPLDALQAAVAAEDTVIDSAVALIQGLAAQVAALQPNQAAIDALAADVNARATALANAVAAGTPPASVPGS